MDVKAKLKNLLFVDKNPKPAQPAQTSPTSVIQQVPLPVVQVTTEDFSVFCQQLYDALEAANMPGQDYMDLRQALKNMANLAMGEEQKFQAIFATMATSGADSESFKQSFDYYKNILLGEKQKFEEAIEGAISDSVRAKQRTLQELTDTNAKDEAEIKRLSDEIASNNSQITALQVEVSSATSKLDQKKQSFEAAYQKIEKEIDDDCLKSQKYINILPAAPVTTKTPIRRNTKKEK